MVPYNSRAVVVRLLADRCDKKSNVELVGFRSNLRASYLSGYTEEMVLRI